MAPRFFVDQLPKPMTVHDAEQVVVLPAGPARHVQVLRLQPGAALTLFDGNGGEWQASIASMGRSAVGVRLIAHDAVERELPFDLTLALGMPANERMDVLVEKATELGVAAIQPLMCERSVLRLVGDRAAKKVAHWQAVAVSACEQSGRTRVPKIAPVQTLGGWLSGLPSASALDKSSRRWLLSFDEAALEAHAVVGAALASRAPITCLSGPEGGLAAAEEAAAVAAGFAPISLGPRVLRADTAPLALLAHLGLASGARLR